MSRPAKHGRVLTADRARELLDYSPETGSLVWKSKAQKSPVVVGSKAGHVNRRGYGVIYLDNRQYRVHRVIWLYMTGAWPVEVIDHINGDPSDNRFANLREATYAINSQNKRRAAGATKLRDGKWQASIKTMGTQHYIGRFDSLDEAQSAYIAAKRVLHEGCTV